MLPRAKDQKVMFLKFLTFKPVFYLYISPFFSQEQNTWSRPLVVTELAHFTLELLCAFTGFPQRPINVPCRWNSTAMMPEEHPKKQGMPAFPFNHQSSMENQYMVNESSENFRSSYFGFSRHVSSPETISLEPNSHRRVKISVDDLDLNSPSSAVSSLCEDPEARAGIQDNVIQEPEAGQEEDEVMSSYVIEITSNRKEETEEAVRIDEAIAWAKEKFQAKNYEKQWSAREEERSNETEERPNEFEMLGGQMDGHHAMRSLEEGEPKKWTTGGGNQQSENDMEMELLDRDIKLWSAGKETNIHLLLSTLHQILWSNSGWYAIPLTSLTETSLVKKAYQKARLCLHPDKLQQRGATVPQKYVAEKAFSILQDAWAAFISQDVFLANG